MHVLTDECMMKILLLKTITGQCVRQTQTDRVGVVALRRADRHLSPWQQPQSPAMDFLWERTSGIICRHDLVSSGSSVFNRAVNAFTQLKFIWRLKPVSTSNKTNDRKVKPMFKYGVKWSRGIKAPPTLIKAPPTLLQNHDALQVVRNMFKTSHDGGPDLRMTPDPT